MKKISKGRALLAGIQHRIPTLLGLTAVWLVWQGELSFRSLAQGFVLSLLALELTNRFFFCRAYHRHYRISLLVLLRYFLVLIKEIFRSGVHAIAITLAGRLNVGVIDLPTEITDPLTAALVANAITLTPGTVTVDYTPGRFKVIWIDCTTSDPDLAGKQIKGSFERVLAGGKKG